MAPRTDPAGTSSRARVQPIVRRRRPEPPRSVGPIDLSGARLLEIRPSAQSYEEDLATEIRKFDNRRTRSSSVETFVVRRSHRIVAKVDLQRGRTVPFTGKVNLLGAVEVESGWTNEIRRSVGFDREIELTCEQSTSITVPGKTRVVVEILWKLVWQQGSCRVSTAAGLLVFPYSVTKELRFDKKAYDK